jgi:hypothetical protein
MLEERSAFVKLYANLLLSKESDNPERVWVNEPLWKPILQFLETNIPTYIKTKDEFLLKKYLLMLE